jgi:phosphoglycolate phosphatase
VRDGPGERVAQILRLVIFDFDGTLADSWPLAADMLVAQASRFRYRQFTRDEIERLRALPTREVFRALEIAPWRLPGIIRAMRKDLERSHHAIPLFQGVSAMLHALKASGLQIGVVSSNSLATIIRTLGSEAMNCITFTECGASLYGKAKRLRRMLRRAGVEETEAVAVGDDTRDLDAASKAGLPGLAVEWGYAEAALLRTLAPGRSFQSIADLTAYLLGRTGRSGQE